MAKKIFRENQRYQRWELVTMIAVLIIGLSYRLFDLQFISGAEDSIPVWNYVLPLLLLITALYFILSLKLSVRITDKHISFKLFPWERKPQKIKWENVAEYNIVETPEPAQWSGWNVNFSQEKMYSVCGRTGLKLTTTDGEEIFIGSRRLGKLKKAIKKAFKK